MNISRKNPPSAHKAIMHSLGSANETLDRLILGKRLVLMDIPVYPNVGDLLIMLGTLSYLEKSSGRPALIVSAYNPCFDAIQKDDVILMQGGGNLGDLYPIHRSLREEVIRRFPGNRIVMLPQSIHFQDPDNLDRCMSLFASHQDLHLFVRDRSSLELGAALGNRCTMAPDMAHYLYPIQPDGHPRLQRLYLLRKDSEAARTQRPEPPEGHQDWHDILGRHRRMIRFFRSAFKRARRPGTANIVANIWLAYCRHIVRRVTSVYGAHHAITTDRLHGHIMGCLMDMPNEVLDNSYGKNSRYIEVWTGGSPLVTLSGSRDTRK